MIFVVSKSMLWYDHSFAKMCSLIETFPQVSDVDHGPCSIFSLPEPIEICPLSIVIIAVIVLVVNFSKFCLLLQNHSANFNQT